MAKRSTSEPLVHEARERLDAAWTQDQENRDDANIDLKFLAGDQWPSTVRQAREGDGRPCLTINRLPQFVHAVANDIRANPPAIRCTPVDGKNDPQLAKIFSGLIRDIEYRSDAASVYAMAGGHAVACGIGHFRITTDYAHDETFDQEICIKRIPHPLSVFWDPGAIMPDRSDAKWCIVTELMHVDEFKATYPKFTPSSFDTPTSSTAAESGLYWRNGDFVRIAEYWRVIPQKRRIALLQDNAIIDITGLPKEQLNGLPIAREREVDGSRIESVLLSASDVLEESRPWAGRYIPIVPVVGGEIPLETKIVRYGLIRFSRDPQQLYNYARTAAAESMGLAPKAPYLVTPKQIGKYKAQWDSHNTTQRPYLLYEPDERVPGGKPTREMPPDVPVAFVQEAQVAQEDMKATTGIYDASLGARSNETSGRAIVARERQGDAATAHFADNLKASIRRCGHILIDLIPRIYDTQRQVRILGEDGEAEDFVKINHPVMSDRGTPMLLNDLSQGRFDVRLRTGPNYATRRLEAADAMLQFVQAVPQAAALIGDLIATNMDWPGADQIAERLKRAVPPNILGPDAVDKDDPQAQQQAAQAAQQAQQVQKMQELAAKLEVMLKGAELEKKRADARKSSASAQQDRLKTLIDAITAGIQPPPDGFEEDEAMAQDLLGTAGQEAPAMNGMPPNAQMQPQMPEMGGEQPVDDEMLQALLAGQQQAG